MRLEEDGLCSSPQISSSPGLNHEKVRKCWKTKIGKGRRKQTNKKLRQGLRVPGVKRTPLTLWLPSNSGEQIFFLPGVPPFISLNSFRSAHSGEFLLPEERSLARQLPDPSSLPQSHLYGPSKRSLKAADVLACCCCRLSPRSRLSKLQTLTAYLSTCWVPVSLWLPWVLPSDGFCGQWLQTRSAFSTGVISGPLGPYLSFLLRGRPSQCKQLTCQNRPCSKARGFHFLIFKPYQNLAEIDTENAVPWLERLLLR